MVYLKSITDTLKKAIIKFGDIKTYCYNFITNENNSYKANVFNSPIDIACAGYSNIKIPMDIIEPVITRSEIDNIPFNVYTLLGIYLASNQNRIIYQKIEKRFYEFDEKSQYLISKVVPDFKEKLCNILKNCESVTNVQIILKYLLLDEYTESIQDNIIKFLKNSKDFNDLIIIEDIENKMLLDEIKLPNLSFKESIVQILNEFANASKAVIERRKNHTTYEIKDEYDVQDLLKVIFKATFPKVIPEENVGKVGGSATRVDFIFRSLKLMLEIKMIKDYDTNTKEYIKQIKEDINSYYIYDPEYIIFYVYDPYRKISDVHEFYDINGKYSFDKGDIKASADVIVIIGR